MRKIYLLILLFLVSSGAITVNAQNISINTSGAANSTLSMFEVLQISTTANTKGLHVAHSGAIAGTGYGIWVEKTGGSTTNIAGYFSASGGTNNYPGIFMGGNVGIGTIVPGAKLSFNDLNDGSNGADGITWYNLAPTSYGIFRTAGAWSAPNYQQLNVSWQTGLIIDGGSLYGKSGTIMQPSGGNVGVGQAVNAAYNLEVNGSFGFGDGTAGTYRSRTESRADAGQMGAQSGFYQTSAPAPAADWPVGAGSWWHLLDIRHSNPGNNYAMQFAGSFFDQDLYFRKTNNNAAQAWSQILTTASTGYIKNQFAGAQAADHWVSGSSRATEVYAANWFRNDASGTGLYNQANGAGIYSTGPQLMSTYNGSAFNIEGVSNAAGNLRFQAANPYIVSSSYFVCPGGAYFNSGTVYTEAQYQCRGGIHNDNGSALTIAGGSDASLTSYFPNNVGIGINPPAYKLHVVGNLNNAPVAQFENASAGGWGVYGVNTAAAGTTANSHGVYGVTSQGNAVGSGSAGVVGFSTNNSNPGTTGGVGVMAAGSNQAFNALVQGNGGAFTGDRFGLFAEEWSTLGSSSGSFTAAIYSLDGSGNSVSVNAWNGFTHYKILGGGVVSTVIPDLKGDLVTLHCPETPEFYFQDYGQGQLVNGKTHIDIDPILAKNIVISEKHPLRAFVQLYGNCNGVYITNTTATGFDVVELNGGTSNAPFQWTITCNVKDQIESGRINHTADIRFEPGPIKEKTFNEKGERK